MKTIVIITGASSGIGREFALQLDRAGEYDEIWLVARRLQRLKEVAAQFVKTTAIPVRADLGNPEELARLTARIRRSKAKVGLLVNNAGFGKFGSFTELDRSTQTSMIDLNVRSLVALSYDILSFMGKGSAIIQVASTVGYIPFPYFSVYAASKAFVLHFSLSLAAEVAERGITVMALCPGPVTTEFSLVASGQERKLPGEWPADKTVAAALKHLRKGKWISIPRLLWRIMAFSRHFMSMRRTAKLLAKSVRKLLTQPGRMDS